MVMDQLCGEKLGGIERGGENGSGDGKGWKQWETAIHEHHRKKKKRHQSNRGQVSRPYSPQTPGEMRGAIKLCYTDRIEPKADNEKAICANKTCVKVTDTPEAVQVNRSDL